MRLFQWLKDAARAVVLMIALLLMGCAHDEPLVRVEKVPPPPVIVVPSRPDLVGQPPNEQVRGLYDYVLRLEAALKEAILALRVYDKEGK